MTLLSFSSHWSTAARRMIYVGIYFCASLMAPLAQALPPGTLLAAGSGKLLAIDPTTGDRTLISGDGVGAGPDFSSRPSDVLIDPSGDYVIADFDLRALVRVDAATGDRTIIASETVGIGGAFRTSVVDVEPDGSLLVYNIESDAIERVDPVSGDRTPISSATLGTGPNLSSVRDLQRVGRRGTLEGAIGDVIAVDSNLNAVLLISTSDGDRTVISASEDGSSGVDFLTPRGYARVSPSEVFIAPQYVIDSGLNALIRVEDSIPAVLGSREIVSSSGVGAGPDFSFPYSVWPSAHGLGVYVSDFNLQAMFYVDIETGNRSIISSDEVGTGPSLGSIRSLAAVPVEQRLVWGFEGLAPGELPAPIFGFPSLFAGNVSVQNTEDFSGGVVAAEGSQVLYLSTGAGNRGEPTGMDDSGDGRLEYDESFVVLNVPRGQNDPGKLRLSANFLTSDAGAPDTAEILREIAGSFGENRIPLEQFSMNQANAPGFTPITSFSGTPVNAPDTSSFALGDSGFQTFEFDVDYPGIILVFRVRDESDGVFDTAMFIDDIRYVPEPAISSALALGLAALVVFRRRGRDSDSLALGKECESPRSGL